MGGFGVGGWFRGRWVVGVGEMYPQPYADILLLTLNYTSIPSFIQIGLKLPKFCIRGGSGVGGWDGFITGFLFGQRPR